MLQGKLGSLWILFAVFFRIASSQYVAATGVKTGLNNPSGARPFRKNILDLQNDVPAWSLYIQALEAFKSVDESDPLSYYQFTGIHGLPFVSWNNISQAPGSTSDTWGGYCPHSSALFATWHRPYMALFEQILGAHAQNIAKQYPDSMRAEYQAAADNLRAPYWDWASTPEMPDSTNQATLQITTPTGVQSVPNPLVQYTFQKFPLDPALFPASTLSNDPHTLRSPDSATSESNPATGNSQLAGENLMSRTFNVLVKPQTYDEFSTSAVPGTSLEAVHGVIHGDVGGTYGHMSTVEWAAYDPIFWLHHCNVDRLFALWVAINPGKELTPLSEPGTYALSPKSIDTADTPLYPFTSDTAGNEYTSMGSMGTKDFGYAYPEIEDWHQTVPELQANVSQQINYMYNPDDTFRQNPRTSKRGSADQNQTAYAFGSQIREWSAGIQVSKYAVEGKYFIVRFFVGDVPSDPKDWTSSPNYISSVHIMPPSYVSGQPSSSNLLYDELNLRKAVPNSGNGTDASSVAKYFSGALQWRVQKSDGTVVDNDKVPTLNVTVYDEIVTLPTAATELPSYGERTMHPNITKSKAGGYGYSSGGY